MDNARALHVDGHEIARAILVCRLCCIVEKSMFSTIKKL